MDNNRIQELMNKVLDKSVTKEEQVELECYLTEHPEEQQNFDELKNSSMLVGNLPEYEPSPNIKKNILNAVDSSIRNSQKMNSSEKSFWIKNLLPFKSKITFSIAFSVIIVLCVFLLWYTTGKTTITNETVSGYLGKSESVIDASSSYYTDLIGIQSSLNIYQRKDTLMVVMDKKSTEDISVGYHFEPEFVSFLGVKETKPTSPLIQKVEGNASVTIQDPSKILMMFQVLKPASTMDLQIRDASRQIFRYKFTVGQKK